MHYAICVERKLGHEDITSACEQTSSSWSSLYSLDNTTVITFSRDELTVHCNPTTSGGHNTYKVSVQDGKETLLWGNDPTYFENSLVQPENLTLFEDATRGFSETRAQYTLVRGGAATENNPTDACEWELQRTDELIIHVRFYNENDIASDVIQHSTITVDINNNQETITSDGFDTTSERNMTEKLDKLTEVTSEGIAEQITEEDEDFSGDEESSFAADIAIGTFQVTCEGTLAKLGSTVIKARQISAFEMTVEECIISGTNAHEVEVHWESLVQDYDNFEFTLNACGERLNKSFALFPHEAQSLGQTGAVCDSQYSEFNFTDFDESENIVTDRIAFSTGEAGQINVLNTDVNNCVYSKGGENLGECGDQLSTDEQDDNTYISFALAQYEHQDDEAGFQVKFYTVVNDKNVRSLDISMQLKLDAEFRETSAV